MLALRGLEVWSQPSFRHCGEVRLPQHNWTSGQTAPAPDAPPVVHPALRPHLPLGAFSGRGVLSPLLHVNCRNQFYTRTAPGWWAAQRRLQALSGRSIRCLMVTQPDFQPYLALVHGVDVVDVKDYARLLNPAMRPHLKTTFTAQELQECGDNERTAERLAGRFATKEAVLKALGLPYGDGIAFLDIETVTNAIGAPTILTYRKVNERAYLLGVQAWLVSTTHTSTIAFSSVIGIRAPVIG